MVQEAPVLQELYLLGSFGYTDVRLVCERPNTFMKVVTFNQKRSHVKAVSVATGEVFG